MFNSSVDALQSRSIIIEKVSMKAINARTSILSRICLKGCSDVCVIEEGCDIGLIIVVKCVCTSEFAKIVVAINAVFPINSERGWG